MNAVPRRESQDSKNVAAATASALLEATLSRSMVSGITDAGYDGSLFANHYSNAGEARACKTGFKLG
jgi:hypothetical protein